MQPRDWPKTYRAYKEEYRVKTIERRFQQLLLNILMQQTQPPIGVCAPALCTSARLAGAIAIEPRGYHI